MRLRDAGLLFSLAALWGGSFLFIRVAAPVLGPFLLVDSRLWIAGLALLIYTAVIRFKVGLRQHWKQFLILSLFNAAIPFSLISFAELNLTASFASILNATTPLFTALVASVWINDALTLKKVGGLLIGMLGVAVVVGWSSIEISLTVILSVGASLLAALSYGIAGVYSKRTFKNIPALTISTSQQLLGAIIMLPLAAFGTATDVNWSGINLTVILCVLGLALISTSMAYLIYFRLIAESGPTIAASVTFIVPVFSILWAALFLNEQPGPGLVLGFLIILVGLVLVMDLQFRRPAPQPVQKLS